MSTRAPIAALLGAGWFAVAARAVLTLPYWWSGFAKLTNLPAALGEVRHFGLEPAGLVVGATILVQLAGSMLLIAGRWAWLAAGALSIFTAAATLIAHKFWVLEDPVARFQDRNTFLEHVGLIGGLALAVVTAERSKAT